MTREKEATTRRRPGGEEVSRRRRSARGRRWGHGAMGGEKRGLAACPTKRELHFGTAGEKGRLWVKKDRIISNPNVRVRSSPSVPQVPSSTVRR